MVDGSPKGEPLQDQMERYIAERHQWLAEAVGVVTGDPTRPLDTVFDMPMAKQGDARRDSPTPELTSEQDSRLREVAGRFGIGGEQDVLLTEAGLPARHVALNEGGLAWKMAAEAEINDDTAGIYLFAGSPHVKTTAAEKSFERRFFGLAEGQEDPTQYHTAQRIAESQPDYVPLEAPMTMPFGYDIDNDHQLVTAPTGQLVQIGTRNGKPVMLLRVDREDYINENGEPKFRKQPDTAALMTFVSKVLEANGDSTTAVGLVTSNTYSSRAIDAVRAGYESGRQFGVAMYGRNTLGSIKGETPQPTELMQIPGELRVMHEKLLLLEQTVRTVAEQ